MFFSPSLLLIYVRFSRRGSWISKHKLPRKIPSRAVDGIRTQWCTSQKHIHSTRRNLENISQYLPQSSIQMAKYILISTLALCMGAFLASAMPVHHMERRQDERQNLLQQFRNEYQNNFSEAGFSGNLTCYICRLTSLMKIGSHLQCSVCTCKH